VGRSKPHPPGTPAQGAKGRPGPTRTARAGRSRPSGPDGIQERSLADLGFEVVAGLDEVGRGAWAGPVSVGVVVFPPDDEHPPGVRDSKELSEESREALFPLIVAWCADWSVGHAEAIECDRLGMTAALRLAARRALGGLRLRPHALLMDGNFDYVSEPEGAASPAPSAPHVRTVVRGDAACVSIAAASIVAKVTRDRHMRALSPSFPAFDFHANKGYPTPVHRRALDGNGLTSLHRRSWSFVDDLAFR
jgi:ribonuclease HII